MAAMTQVLGANPRLAVVGAELRSGDGSPAPSAWRFPVPWRTVLGSAVGLGRAYRPTLGGRGSADLGAAFVPFTAALLRRTVFDRLGGLDESFWLYGEDADYCYRAVLEGHGIGLAPGASARHQGGASRESLPDEAAASFLRGGDRFRAKHFPRWSAALAGAALLAGGRGRLALDGLRRRLGRPDDGHYQEWLQVVRHYSRG